MAQVKAKTGWTEDKPLTAQEGSFQLMGYDSAGIRKNQAQIQALIDKSTAELNKGRKDAAALLLMDAYNSADLRDESGTVVAEGDPRLKATLAIRVGDLIREHAGELQGRGDGENALAAHRDAVVWYGRSIAHNPAAGNVQEAYNGLGVSQHALGDAAGAGASFARAIEANADRMGRVRAIIDKDGNDGLAKRELGRLVEDQRSYRNNLGVARYVLGDKAAARDSIIAGAFNLERDPQLGQVLCKNKTICENVAQLAAERIAELQAQPGGPDQAELSREQDLKLLAEKRIETNVKDGKTVFGRVATLALSALDRLRRKREPKAKAAEAPPETEERKTWNYTAMDASGREVQGTIPAETQSEAIQQVKDLGLFPTRIVESGVRKQS